MRELDAQTVTQAVRQLCIDANRVLPSDLEALVKQRSVEEPDQMAQSILCDLCRNLDAAREMGIPICQDTGMAVVFAEVGQELHIQGDFETAVNEGVRRGYVESSQEKQDRRVSRLRLLPASQSAVQRLAQARGDVLSKLCKGVTQEEFAAFFSMVGKMVDNLGDMPLEDELRLENEFEKGSVKGQ